MDSMADRAQALLRKALAFSSDERADVAAEFLASLEESAAEELAARCRLLNPPVNRGGSARSYCRGSNQSLEDPRIRMQPEASSEL